MVDIGLLGTQGFGSGNWRSQSNGHRIQVSGICAWLHRHAMLVGGMWWYKTRVRHLSWKTQPLLAPPNTLA
jgi:hypothetical protein